ncbi:MAG TPA: APC family permease [Candidatus Nanopelagicales bacterium]
MFDMILFSVCAILLLSQVTLTAQIGPSAIIWTVLIIVLFFVPYGLITAELGSTYPDTGGIYSWVVRAFGPRWGTRTSWWYWVNVALWVPSVYLMFSAVLSAMFFPDLTFWPQVLIALALIAVNWVVNLVTLDTGKWVSNLGAIITVAVIALLGVGGIKVAMAGDAATTLTWSTDSMIPTWSTMALAVSIIIYNFLGFELMSSASQEMRHPKRDVPRTILVAGVLIGAFYLMATMGMQAILPVDQISETSGLMDAVQVAFGDNAFTDLVGVGILYAFFAALIPWTIGANRAAAEAARRGDLPPVFATMSARRGTPTGAAHLTAAVSAIFTVTYGVLYWRTDGSIDELFWSIFAFSSIVFLLPYVVMSLAFLRLRVTDAAAHRPYAVPGGRLGAWAAALLCVGALLLAIVFFVVDPFDLSLFDAQTFWLIVGGLAVTFVVQEVFVWRSPRWRARLREHPELGAAVELDGSAPDDAAALVTGELPASPTDVADRSTPQHPASPPTRA